MTIREIARAKINLWLTVAGRRADGYHELESLVTFVNGGDLLTLSPGPAAVVTRGPFAADIVGPNLLERTLEALRRCDAQLRVGRVELEKNLPVAAGLGGGSADAAALLRAVRRANPERAASIPWGHVAVGLGADVPVCLAAGPALVSGMGEEVAPVVDLPVMEAVLVNPRLPLATADVFRALRAGVAPAHRRRELPAALRDVEDVAAYMRARGNDLEGAATSLLPIIADIKSALAELPGCRAAAMSGSGPTCFGIFSSRLTARAGAAALRARWPDFWILPGELAGSAPAPFSSRG
jgi:4-diphosphocytidyl-2-C-methyl-D-erythritol kinase